MLFQGLAPRMQDHGNPEFPAEPRGVTPEGLQGGRSGLKEEAIEEAGVALGEGVQVWGRVNTQWKYGMGNRSRSRASTQRTFASVWHLGQCRFWHE